MANMRFFPSVLMVFLAISTTDVEAVAKSYSLYVVNTKTNSPCQSGLIHGEGDFTVTARVDTENVTRSASERAQCIILGTKFNETVCTVYLNSCLKQNSSSTASCYCVDIGNGDYHVVFTKRADVRYSKAQIAVAYSHDEDNYSVNASSNKWEVPETFYKDTEELTLESNGIQVNLTSSQCTLPLREGLNTFKYCCSNAPSCEVKITKPDGRESVGTGCYKLTTYGISESLPYVFSYSVCGVESSQTYSCAGKLAPELLPTQPPRDKGETLHPGIIVTIVTVVFTVIIISSVK